VSAHTTPRISSNRSDEFWSEHDPIMSIIVACYAVRRYLPSFIEALGRQTIDPSRYEIIFVSDGCPEDSGEVVRDWMHSSPFPVRLIEKENGGVASAPAGASRPPPPLLPRPPPTFGTGRFPPPQRLEEFVRQRSDPARPIDGSLREEHPVAAFAERGRPAREFLGPGEATHQFRRLNGRHRARWTSNADPGELDQIGEDRPGLLAFGHLGRDPPATCRDPREASSGRRPGRRPGTVGRDGCGAASGQ